MTKPRLALQDAIEMNVAVAAGRTRCLSSPANKPDRKQQEEKDISREARQGQRIGFQRVSPKFLKINVKTRMVSTSEYGDWESNNHHVSGDYYTAARLNSGREL